MLNSPCRVLLIEDELEDTANIQAILQNTRSAFFKQGFILNCAETLAEAKQIIAQQQFDVILLDLMLPDSRYMDSLKQVQTAAPSTPIIVQTALEDEVVAVKALELGASGYLPKITSERDLLLYAIRAAIERKLQLADLEKSQQQQQQQEFDLLKGLLIDSDANSSDRHQRTDSLQQRMPDIYSELATKYGNLLDRFVEQKIYKVEYDLNNQINILIEQLGYLQATPRDIISLHTNLLKQKQQDLGQRKSKAFTIEGRYLLLKLMSKLATYYRRYYIGLNKINLAYSYRNSSLSD
ncbi:MAG: hypothetical protein Tsb0014_06520 [Pleurocapsa sp.]